MEKRLNWGIIATGGIARAFARGVAHSAGGRVVALASRTESSAAAFAQEFALERAYGSYAALLADPQVEAVYIATPHPQHVEWVIAAAAAGKHVLCEKPLGMSAAEAQEAVKACQRAGVLLMEAFMYRCHPQTARVVDIVRSGVLGRVGLIQAAFGYAGAFDPASRFWNKALGGGGILDVGCYPVSFARLIAGVQHGKAFAEPIRVRGSVRLDERTGVDAWAAATLDFGDGLIAQVSTSIALNQDNSARIYGTDGWLHIPEPWVPARESGATRLFLHRNGAAEPETIEVAADDWLYGIEADAVATALAAGQREVAAVTPADTLGNMAVLDAWRRCAGEP